MLEKGSRNLEKTNGVRRTWSKLEYRKRKVKNVVVNCENEDKLRVETT